MYLQALYLKNFRNYEDAWIEFGPCINNIYGLNAQGKTNLLEAIHFLIIGRSFRVNALQDLIREGASSMYMEGHFVKNGIEQKLAVSFEGKSRKLVYNSTTYHSLSKLLGLLQGVMLSPEDRTLVNGAPMLRRRYMDMQIAQINPLYVHYLLRYHRAMKQRNHLLKLRQIVSLDVWEHEMAKSAAYIVQERRKVLGRLAGYSQSLQSILSAGADLMTLLYQTQVPEDLSLTDVSYFYLKKFESSRSKEMDVRRTLSGPHRDDMLIQVSNREAKYFASEGQKCCCAASLRLAEWQLLESSIGETPLIGIDDIETSLDPIRRKAIKDYIGHLGQVFISSTEPWEIDLEGGRTRFISVEKGKILESRQV